jgi:hypothetical protein
MHGAAAAGPQPAGVDQRQAEALRGTIQACEPAHGNRPTMAQARRQPRCARVVIVPKGKRPKQWQARILKNEDHKLELG